MEIDKLLYQRFLDGDQYAFEELVLKNKDSLIYFLKRYVSDIFICEDIAQDVLLTFMYIKRNILMKSDRDFLNGIYHKSEALKQVYSERLPFAFTRKSKGFIVAAALILVIAPSLYFSTLPTMKISTEYNNQTPQIARFRSFVDISEVTEQSDLVVRAKVKDIDKSVYKNGNITTTVELRPEEIYKGTLETKTIELVVNGGFDKATKTYFEYESIFKRNEDTLLFLTKIKDKYSLTSSSQGKYIFLKTTDKGRTYQGSARGTLTLSELKKLIEKGK